jgi:hypothetical protein
LLSDHRRGAEEACVNAVSKDAHDGAGACTNRACVTANERELSLG